MTGMGAELTLPPHAFVQRLGELGFGLAGVQEVDVDVEAAAVAIGDGRGEGSVCGAGGGWGRVDEGFAVGGFFAGMDGFSWLLV